MTPFFEALGLTGSTLADVDWTQVVYPDETPSYLDDRRYPRTTTEYHATGEVKAHIDERGNRTEYRYDALGRRIETIYPDKTPDTLDDNYGTPFNTAENRQRGSQQPRVSIAPVRRDGLSLPAVGASLRPRVHDLYRDGTSF
ncbi:RHS repeat domain-containing protein [Baaleninema simplex]|uniref:RHS repeat domain-containing protein n=1 Tax=Baaleninema simplex TaxID=2862350 RepID=UPI00034988A2|nr:RHS repeat domain-containing protein [Baaleninema simplex]